MNNRCVRRHFLSTSKHGNKKRVPFQTCSMICGPPNLWPQPTIKTVLSSKALKLKSSDIKFSVNSEYKNVNNLLKNAFDIFLREVQGFEAGYRGSGGVATSNDDVAMGKKGSGSSGGGENHDNNNNFVEANDKNDNNEISDNFLPFLSMGSQKKYDVTSFNINAKVTQHADTYLTLHTDESYNLTLSCKYISFLLLQSFN